jgi:hypothetical protein
VAGPTGVWSASLRWMEWIANPALAGLAVTLLGLGVVTWLPALAAAAHSLDRWRRDGDPAVFRGTIAAFPAMWRRLRIPGVGCGIAMIILVADVVFLAGRPEVWAQALAAVLVGIGLALGTWAYALAVVTGTAPADDAADRPAGAAPPYGPALRLAFGGPGSLLIILSALAAGVLLLPTGIGPILFGPSIPLLIGRRLWLRRTAGPGGSDNVQLA